MAISTLDTIIRFPQWLLVRAERTVWVLPNWRKFEPSWPACAHLFDGP